MMSLGKLLLYNNHSRFKNGDQLMWYGHVCLEVWPVWGICSYLYMCLSHSFWDMIVINRIFPGNYTGMVFYVTFYGPLSHLLAVNAVQPLMAHWIALISSLHWLGFTIILQYPSANNSNLWFHERVSYTILLCTSEL